MRTLLSQRPRDARCAASHQKATPRTEVIPVVAISETTVLMSDRYLLSRTRDITAVALTMPSTPTLCLSTPRRGVE